MSSLGQILLDKSWITEGQLEQAIERQQQLGGRLGTCFLELGFLDEGLLLQALAEQLGAPVATAEDLESIEPDTLALLPAKTAIRSRAVPFRSSSGTVDIALIDVGDLTLEDELSFIVSKRVQFHVATELRLVEALAKYYGCNIPLRMSTLAQRHSAAPSETETLDPPEPSGQKPHTAGARAASELPSGRGVVPRQAPEQPTSIPLTAEERAALAEVRGQVTDPVVTARESFAIDLVRAETSTDIGEALLAVLIPYFVRVLLFRVSGSRQEVTGWLCAGPEVDIEWFESYSIGLRQSSIFRQLLSDRDVFVGRLESHPAHVALARCWGGSLDHECLIAPVFVRQRLISVAYCDRGPFGLADLDLPLIERLRNKAAIAFERCILRRKLQVT